MLVGMSGKYFVMCVVDVCDGREMIEVCVEGDVFGLYMGYVWDVATTRDGRTAWSCACNFALKWMCGEDGMWMVVVVCEMLWLFMGDILCLCVFEDGDDVIVFCGVVDGTVRAFDASTTTSWDLGVVGGDVSVMRG